MNVYSLKLFSRYIQWWNNSQGSQQKVVSCGPVCGQTSRLGDRTPCHLILVDFNRSSLTLQQGQQTQTATV